MDMVPAIQTETKFVEIGLQFSAAAMVSAQEKSLEIAD